METVPCLHASASAGRQWRNLGALETPIHVDGLVHRAPLTHAHIVHPLISERIAA